MNNNNDTSPVITEQKITFDINGKTCDAYITFNKNQEEKRPGIIVAPEWWGLNDYIRQRARDLAELGYIALAIDVYGDGKTANTPQEAQALASEYYNDLPKAKTAIDSAIETIKTYPQTDPENLAAIGYCFGGGLVLNAARLGAELKGVVSFHGGLKGVKPEKEKIKARILVCHGAADPFEMDNVDGFLKEMDEAGVDYIFKSYPDAVHAFSNPNATAKGKEFNMPIEYNEEADRNSWQDMQDFFSNIFK